MFPDPSVHLSHAILYKDWGISLSPFEEGLCASGTVAIAGLRAQPDERRAHVLAAPGPATAPGPRKRGAERRLHLGRAPPD